MTEFFRDLIKKTTPELKLLEPFVLKKAQKQKFIENFINCLESSLKTDDIDERGFACFNSFVTNIPNHEVKGEFIALDVGGSYYKIYHIIFNEEKRIKQDFTSISFPRLLLNATSEEFFDFMSEEIVKFLKKRDLEQRKFDVGMTFSFPCEVKSLNNSTIISWTKNFNVKGSIGEDVAAMFEKSFRKFNLKLNIKAIVNDSVATLAATSIKCSDCCIGVIVGTGFNTSYSEKVKNITRDDTKGIVGESTIVNTECGDFGKFDELKDIITEYDSEINGLSTKPGRQRLEKMVSGLYLGELMRQVMLKMCKNNLLFDGIFPECLKQRNSFESRYVFEIASDKGNTFFEAERIAHVVYNLDLTRDDMLNMKKIATVILTRSANLVALTIVAHILKLKAKKITVGVDGSLFRHCSLFRFIIDETIKEFLPADYEFHLKISEAGSGIGVAAIVAAEQVKV